MNSTLCRCMSYYRVQTAIKRAARAMADASAASAKEVVA
jgi:aerobic-type carbon monoxide dehydrogenase small subunit (CoxS/CutS family)